MPRRRGGDESEGGSQLAPTGAAGSLARLGTDDMVRPPDPELPEVYERQPIAPAVANRLRSLTRHEARSQKPRYFKPTWSQGRSLPGLIVAQRWARDDAFGCARQIAELDAALRRGTALIELFSSGERVDTWPRPIRPERGGLWLLDAGYGSLDRLWDARIGRSKYASQFGLLCQSRMEFQQICLSDGPHVGSTSSRSSRTRSSSQRSRSATDRLL